MISILGVDPGTVSGWAVLVAERNGPAQVLAHGQTGRRGKRTEPATGPEAMEAIRAAHRLLTARAAWPPVLAIESQYIPPTGQGKRGAQVDYAKASAVLNTARHAGGWIYLAQCSRIQTFSPDPRRVGVHPSTWRAAVFGPRGPRMSENEAKRAAVEIVAGLHGIRLAQTHHHTAEAILIAGWAAADIRYRGLLTA